MNICFLLGGLTANGGIGRVTTMLANQLAKAEENDISILSYYRSESQILYPVDAAVKLDYLLDKRESMISFLLCGGERVLRKYLQNNKIDLLVACGALFFPLAVRATKRVKTKCLCWEHTDPRGNHDYRMQQYARLYGINRSDWNVVLTKSALSVYRKEYHVENVCQIYNPVDERILSNSTSYDVKSKKIISVGRLTYQKNFQRAIQIAAQILPKHPEWHWDIYGEGTDRAELESLIRQHNLENQMHLLGQVNDMYNRYSEYRMMVMTSRYEGFPMTLLEGMGSRLPLISFNVPTGPDEIIIDRENGFLIPSDDTHRMVESIECLMDDTELCIEMGEKGFSRSNQFLTAVIAKQWEMLFCKLCEQK